MEYEKILSFKQINGIMNQQYKCIEESINQVHFNDELPEYNNLFITNLKDDIAYIFNGSKFITVRKNEMLNDLIDTHVNEITTSLEKYKNEINNKYIMRIKDCLNKINDDETKYIDCNNQQTFPNYKTYKQDKLKFNIYNNSDKKCH